MEAIKAAVTNALCLARWSSQRKTRVLTDASKVGIGAALEQKHEEGWRPVAFLEQEIT